MSLSPRMVVTRVARQVSDAATTATATSSSAAAATTTSKIHRVDTSGLTPVEVALTLAVLLGVFTLLLIIGELCKIFNKPKREATPYLSGQQKKLFQPSAAGYGTRIAGLQVPEGKNVYSSRVSLLAGASPMGRGGSHDKRAETMVGTPQSNNSGTDYFGKAGHSRGQSSGIKLPGATAATSRKGGPTHPYTQGSIVAPDGSGFQIGQLVNHNNAGPGPSGYASRPNGISPSERGMHQQPSSVGMGPPPIMDHKRRSRYARPDGRRIDSIGPGTIRKSMYLNEGVIGQEGGPRLPSTSSNLRRIDSVGRGDHRRKSTYTSDPLKGNRTASLYNNGQSEVENFGSGRGVDPLGARGNALTPTRANNQIQGPGPQGYQQQQQQMGMGMPGMQRQVSPSGLPGMQRQPSPNGMPSPNTMGGAAMMARPMQPAAGGYSGYAVGGGGGGGRYTPMGGYDMKTRQVV